MKYYLGWDVGGWHCDANTSSRDALCVLKLANGKPELIGTPWRGNLREKLNRSRGTDLLRALLSCCTDPTDRPLELTIAIDAPLGWPLAAIRLLNGDPAIESPESFRQNPYLFRKTERMLADRGFKPLSCVQDMIGSQSTKGLHLLRAVHSHKTGTGTWQTSCEDVQTVIIETYPSPCEQSQIFLSHYSPLEQADRLREALQGKGENHRKDVLDALRCAVVAWLYAEQESCFAHPTPDVPCEEGWIWLPKDAQG